jgi:hypothetical protein
MGICVDAAPPLNAILLPIYSSTLLFIYSFSPFSLFSFYISIALSSPFPCFFDSLFHFLSRSVVRGQRSIIFSCIHAIMHSCIYLVFGLCSLIFYRRPRSSVRGHIMHPCNHAIMHSCIYLVFGLCTLIFYSRPRSAVRGLLHHPSTGFSSVSEPISIITLSPT